MSPTSLLVANRGEIARRVVEESVQSDFEKLLATETESSEVTTE